MKSPKKPLIYYYGIVLLVIYFKYYDRRYAVCLSQIRSFGAFIFIPYLVYCSLYFSSVSFAAYSFGCRERNVLFYYNRQYYWDYTGVDDDFTTIVFLGYSWLFCCNVSHSFGNREYCSCFQ